MRGSWQRTLAQHRDSTRGRILLAAIALMSEEGMAAASMSAIAERAEVSRPTLYRHFPDIDHIMAAVIEEQFADFRASLEAGMDPSWSALEQLRYLVVAHVRQYASEPSGLSESAMETGLSPTVREVLERELRDHHRRLVAILRAGAEEGSLRADLDPDLHGELLQHLLGGLRMTVHRRDLDLDLLAEPVSDLVLTGLDAHDRVRATDHRHNLADLDTDPDTAT